ncbi:MAG: thiamine-phosphate synthase family protein [Methanocellales archaeon]|nr:thiamine-phosphate synthase family protein [Methanocellales archaeon]
MDAERYRVMKDVQDAVSMLEKCEGFSALIPEVGTNIGMALSGATSTDDVAAVQGRIVRVNGAKAVGNVDFGTSKHVASVILAAMKFDENVRGAMNIKYSPDILSACKKLGFAIASFDRKDEPRDVSTMEWGTKRAIEGFGAVPDVIYDLGSIGKEPMIRLLGQSATEVAKRAIDIANVMRKG